MKKVLSLLLAVVMVIGLMPLSVITAGAAETKAVTKLATFELGANGSATHNDGKENSTYTETVGSYTLSITGGTKMYTGAIDAMGNGCIKFGTSSVIGSCTFTVPDEVTEVIISAAKYKAKNTKIAVNGTTYTLTGSSNDGAYEDIVVNTSTTKTVTFATVSGNTRTMVNSITFNAVTGEDVCTHTNTETIAAVEPTCTEGGNTAGVKCVDCGFVLSGNETIEALGHSNVAGEVTAPTCTEDGYTTYTCSVCGKTSKSDWVDATGHTYVDGTCSACGVVKPTGLDGEYYIAAIRSSGNYMYMTNDLGTASTQRYQLVDSGLTELPESIETTVDSQVFELVASGDGYKIKTGDQYLGWTSGNSGALVDEATAIVATIENGEAAGSYTIHFTASDAERYLSLNSNATNAYYAWYKPGQVSDLYLVPVAAGAEACTHTNTTVSGKVDATCTEPGYTGDTVCADCGATVTEGTATEALGHNYVDGTCTVCGKTEPTTSESTYVLATSIAVGDQVVLVTEQAKMELSSFSTTSTVYGIGTTYDEIPAGTMAWIVEEGTVAGSFSFKNADGNYLYWKSGNSLKSSTTKDAQSSWKVTFDGTDVVLVNAGTVDAPRHVSWNSSSPRFANYKDSSSTGNATYYTTQFYKYTTVDGCVHEVADDAWTIVTAATCETAGLKTGTCSKCGETVEKEIDALGHAYSYNAETGMMVCGNCGDSFMNTIAEAKAYTDANQVYYIKGIVTYVSGKTVYIEDTTGAICVYFTDEENAAGIAVGDELLVWDTMTTYKGLIETTYTKSTEVQVLSNGKALPVQTVTIADLNGDTTNEYLGERVQIVGATIGMINASGNTALTVGTDSINIFKLTNQAANVTENDIVTVTAIVTTFNGYQLAVNPGTAATDVVVTTEGVPSDLELSTVATAKAGTEGTFFKVKGVVTFVDGASVYIQDSTAGIVVRLASGVTAPAVGAEIEATGAYTTYNGLIQLEGATFTEISTGNTVAAKTVTVADLAGAADNAYLSEKVFIEKATITAVGTYNTNYKNVDYTISDGTNTIKLYRTPVATAEEVLEVGTEISVTAVVSTYNGYQLRVVNAADVTVLTAVCEVSGKTYPSVTAALANYDASSEVVKLLADVDEDIILEDDLYIDLNGFTITGMMETDGYTVYGVDSTTDGYTCETIGKFDCVDADGVAVVPAITAKTGTNTYLAIATENGYTFHRYYLGVTHVSVKPSDKGVGYKALFKGDDMVKAQIGGFGYSLQVEGFDAYNMTIDTTKALNGDEIVLRVKNYDVENFGEHKLSANVYMTVGEDTITSTTISYSLKEMVELINATENLGADKIAALAAWIAKSEVMQTWNVGNIYTATEEGTTVPDFENENEL